MTTQPTFFGYASTRTAQPELFAGLPVQSLDTCPTCGRNLVETGSGYWTCPRGCTNLRPAVALDVPANHWNGEDK